MPAEGMRATVTLPPGSTNALMSFELMTWNSQLLSCSSSGATHFVGSSCRAQLFSRRRLCRPLSVTEPSYRVGPGARRTFMCCWYPPPVPSLATSAICRPMRSTRCCAGWPRGGSSCRLLSARICTTAAPEAGENWRFGHAVGCLIGLPAAAHPATASAACQRDQRSTAGSSDYG